MELSKKFNVATSSTVVRIEKFDVDKKYPIVRAERTTTRFGETILLSIQDSSSSSVIFKVFLPKRYASVFSDEDINSINTGKESLNLIYKGTCEKNKIIYFGNWIKCKLFLFFPSFQMDLSAKFRAADSYKITHSELLKTDRTYSVTQAWRAANIVMFVLRDIRDYINSEHIVFLPLHYAAMVSEEDTRAINKEQIWINVTIRKSGKMEIG
jgi:hypothetical protein